MNFSEALIPKKYLIFDAVNATKLRSSLYAGWVVNLCSALRQMGTGSRFESPMQSKVYKKMLKYNAVNYTCAKK